LCRPDRSVSFTVVIQDVKTLGTDFTAEGEALKALRGRADGPTPNTGDAALTHMLDVVLMSLSDLYTIVSADIHTHGTKLTDTANEYGSTEGDIHGLFERLKLAFEDGR